MKVLGVCYDVWISSAALIEDGKIIAAAPEERFNRMKRYRDFPKNAIEFCLKKVGCTIKDIDYVAIGWNPGWHIKQYNPRFIGSIRWRAEYLYAFPNSLIHFFDNKQADSIEQNLVFKDHKCKIVYLDHHLSHAANAFFLSPFEEAAIFSADGRGEDETTLYAIGKGSKITKIDSVMFPHSIGLFYMVFTEFLGFMPHSDEWKVMALASYAGKDNPYYEKVKNLIKLKPNGQVEMDLAYFDYYLHDQLHFYSAKFVKEFGKAREKGEELTERHHQLAGALQRVTEEILIECLNHLQEKTGLKKLVLNGGVFMNSVLNGKLLSQTKFDDVFISSCPDDSGTSIGAGLYVYNEQAEDPKREPQLHNYYGPEFSNDEIKKTLDRYNIKSQYVEDIEKFAAKAIADGELIGWFQGKMEFGQRALGNRSILEEEKDDYFDIEKESFVPFMEKVYMIKKEKQKIIPAVTHVDGSGRLQTVSREVNPRYYKLIEEFRKITGVPVILNTSFNLNGEPIVCAPLDAIKTFFSCGLTTLILGNYVVKK